MVGHPLKVEETLMYLRIRATSTEMGDAFILKSTAWMRSTRPTRIRQLCMLHEEPNLGFLAFCLIGMLDSRKNGRNVTRQVFLRETHQMRTLDPSMIGTPSLSVNSS